MLTEEQINKFNKIFHEQLKPILLENENENELNNITSRESSFHRLNELLKKNHCSQMDRSEYVQLIDLLDDVREECYRMIDSLNEYRE